MGIYLKVKLIGHVVEHNSVGKYHDHIENHDYKLSYCWCLLRIVLIVMKLN